MSTTTSSLDQEPACSPALQPLGEPRLQHRPHERLRLLVLAPQQLEQLRGLFLDVLKSIRRKVPGCCRVHVFYAGPAAGAFLLGQCINPRMDPELAVYEFSRQRDPRYRLAGVLAEEDAL